MVQFPLLSALTYRRNKHTVNDWLSREGGNQAFLCLVNLTNHMLLIIYIHLNRQPATCPRKGSLLSPIFTHSHYPCFISPTFALAMVLNTNTCLGKSWTHRNGWVARDFKDHVLLAPLPWIGIPINEQGYLEPHLAWPSILPGMGSPQCVRGTSSSASLSSQ